MYGCKLLAVAALMSALVVGSADPTVAQTPAPATGTAVAAPAHGTMPVGMNPCCTPCGYAMYPYASMGMAYSAAPMMGHAYYSAQPRRRLFNRTSNTTYAYNMAYPYAPGMGGMYYPAVPQQAMFVTPATGTAVATTTPSKPTTTTPSTETAKTTPPTTTTPTTMPPVTTQPLATLPAGYMMTPNGQLVPMASSSFYYYPTEPFQMESPRRLFRLFRR